MMIYFRNKLFLVIVLAAMVGGIASPLLATDRNDEEPQAAFRTFTPEEEFDLRLAIQKFGDSETANLTALVDGGNHHKAELLLDNMRFGAGQRSYVNGLIEGGNVAMAESFLSKLREMREENLEIPVLPLLACYQQQSGHFNSAWDSCYHAAESRFGNNSRTTLTHHLNKGNARHVFSAWSGGPGGSEQLQWLSKLFLSEFFKLAHINVEELMDSDTLQSVAKKDHRSKFEKLKDGAGGLFS